MPSLICASSLSFPPDPDRAQFATSQFYNVSRGKSTFYTLHTVPSSARHSPSARPSQPPHNLPTSLTLVPTPRAPCFTLPLTPRIYRSCTLAPAPDSTRISRSHAPLLRVSPAHKLVSHAPLPRASPDPAPPCFADFVLLRQKNPGYGRFSPHLPRAANCCTPLTWAFPSSLFMYFLHAPQKPPIIRIFPPLHPSLLSRLP